MNLTKLFKTQAELDKKIIEEKGLQGRDLLDKKILALQVELGELANEWQMFKFWKEDPKPRYETVETYIHGYDGPGTNTRASIEEYRRTPILEEFVDCLHFILSIGNDLGISKFDEYRIIQPESNITDCFLSIFECVSSLDITKDSHDFSYLFRRFKELGRSLGFTWEQIEQAYFEKNKVNHKRQESGY